MPLSIATPQSNAQHFSPIPYTSHLHNEPRTSQIDSQSSNSSHASSPESRPIDLRSPIFEEEEDETSSEAAIEPITPTDGHQTHLPLQEKMTGMMSTGQPNSPKPIPTSSPLSPNGDTGAQPRLVIPTQETPNVEDEIPQPSTPRPPTSKRPTVSVAQGKDSGIKRAVSGFFGRRSKSQSMNSDIQTITQIDGSSVSSINGSESTLPKYPRQPPIRRMSATTFGYAVGSNTPPSPGSLIENCELETPVQEPKSAEFLTPNRKHRSSTGNAIRDRFSKNNISFAASEKEAKYDGRHRSTSVDLKPSERDSNQRYNPPAPERQIWGMAADSGTGLKARRLSLSLPDDFMVDVVELYSEYKDQSKLIGRRGRSIGKGATSHVRLMNKKGASADEVYAVKEFRGKSTTENAEDYEKKVKSEFSIAKSAHHPNVVETFRLCSHNGRWNQVMEFCDHGDLFSLVSQKYLSREERLSDRLCLFKQLVQGLNYLHNHGIAHRDIKLENILITKDSKLKITDFGVSEVFAGIHPGLRAAAGQCGKEMGEVRLCAPGMCGSPPYVAPEVIAKTGEYDPRPLDVWGAAIVMLCMTASGVLWPEARAGSSPLYDELIRGWSIWNAKHPSGTAPSITETDYPHVAFFDNHIRPPALRRVLLTMLNPDPFRRITMNGVANNRWMKNIACCQIDSYDEPKMMIDVSKSGTNLKALNKVVSHNHLPPSKAHTHPFVRLPGSVEMH